MPKKADKKQPKTETDQFVKELQNSDSDDDAVVIDKPPQQQSTLNQPSVTKSNESNNVKKAGEQLTEAEKDSLREELIKTENEISTLKQVLVARQKHAAELKRKLGLSPLSELSQDINRSLKTVTDTEAFQKTAEVTAAATDTVKEKWNDMRNSSIFKSFESKLGSAYNQAKMAASTSIDHLAGATRGANSTVATPVAEEAKPIS